MSGSNGQRMRAVRPSSDFANQARERNRKPAKLWNFNKLVDGKRKRRKPAYCRRADGTYLFYHGKENAIYGETEAGKDMLLAETVAQCLESWVSVAWIDFEEGDEIDCGSRLLQMGVEADQLVDQDLFRFSTPEDVEQARDSIHDAKMSACNVIIFNGLQAMYGMFGWELYDPSSPALFRQMINPLLKAGRTVIETDHLTKSSAEGKNGSRYAAGGIAKLNWINGAAYILEAVDPIILGSVGHSRVILTKDRPGSVKPHCIKMQGEGRMMYAGTLVVKSTEDSRGGFSLNVEVTAPAPGSVVKVRKENKKEHITKDVSDEVLEKVLGLYEKLGNQGASKNTIEGMYQGAGHGQVRAAIAILQVHECLVRAGKSSTSNIAPLRYAKDWDPKQRISNDE